MACRIVRAVDEEHAGALVTSGAQVPAGQLWAGSPAKFRRAVTEKEKEYFPYNADIYVRLAQTYR